MCYLDVMCSGGIRYFRYPPDGLLTTGTFKHDVDIGPIITDSNPFESDDCLDDSPPENFPFLLTTMSKIETMNTGEDEPSSGLNGRLRPRKPTVPPIQMKGPRKSDGKTTLDHIKQTSGPFKTLSNKPNDLSFTKPEIIPAQQQLLCPYCDRKFAYKQTVSKHIRRVHLLTSKQESFTCLYCNHNEADPNEIIRHMVDSHPNQYFACLDCHTRFSSTPELAEHKLNVCEKLKPTYRSKLRQKSSTGPRKNQKKNHNDRKDDYRSDNEKDYPSRHGFNGVVISCELKPAQVHDEADIEDNITTNLILPPSKNLGHNSVLEKNAVIVLDDIQWNKRLPPNFTFHNTDADQILSRLGVVHRSPRTGESTRRDWFKSIDESSQKFEKCFDTSFYSKVASNVQENLAKFLDGSFNFSPDPDNTIKTRKSKNSVVINTAEGFPILLAYEQYSRNVFDGYMPRAIAPKHKWKWDNLENDKNIMNPDQIKRDSHVNNCIITLVSSLDIWTQLCMKRKFEEKYSCLPVQRKTEKQNMISKELKEILESREIPTSSLQLVKHTKPTPLYNSVEFPALLGLTPATPQYDLKPAVLSGEWVRPRCYVCCACGAQTRDSRALSSHISTQHPNAQVQHYEIAGEMLLNADILKHLYVPPSPVSNRTRPMRGFRECTKCKKSVTLEELHQHMLDCAGDTPTVRRKCRYRAFGVRRRRPRLPDDTIRKKIRKDIRSRQRQKRHIRTRPKIRTEVGDAETIRKMIADLPAKRHRVMVNPINSNLRPRKKLVKKTSNLIRKQRAPVDQKIRRSRIQDTIHIKETPFEIDQVEDNTKNDKEDEDNLPLKQRRKRIPLKTTRQSEAFKRKTMLSRAKRKPQTQNMKNLQMLKPMAQLNNEQINLSRDNLPHHVDVNRGPINAREHAGRGGPTNRGDQPAGGRQENNPNNAHVPAQNIPLKHSIARLTADSETHDKSVQFHHMFLVQQECNNITQHVPTGQQQLFENEAAVARPVKPPLPYQKPQCDPIALQKNKLNKPRKGLNDCIAMLRNKLVDPISPSTAQVSVQCGSDEPLDIEPIMMAPPVIPPQPHVDLRPAEIYSRHCLPVSEKVTIKPVRSSRNKPQRSTSLSIEAMPKDIIKVSPRKPSLTLEVIHPKQNPPPTPAKRKSNRLRSASCVSHGPNIHSQLTSLSPRLDQTHASQVAQALHILQLPPAFQLPQVANLSNRFTETSLTPFKAAYISRNVTETHNTRSTRTRSCRDSNKKVESKQRSVEINVLNQAAVKKPVLPEFRSQSQIEIVSEHNSNKFQAPEKRSQEIFIQTTQSKQNTSKSYSDDSVQSKSPPQIVSKQTNRRVSLEICGESNLRDIPAGLASAHTSTSVEFISSTPLDLSGKHLPSDCSETHVNLDNANSYAIYPYNNYETLDLSNKKINNDMSLERGSEVCDVIVDLRIKTSESAQLPPGAKLLNMSTKQTDIIENIIVTDLSMKSREENIPTDLSMKRNYANEFSLISADTISYDAHALSGHKTFIIDDCQNCAGSTEVEQNLTEDIPTDLSGKNTKTVLPTVITHTNVIVTDTPTKSFVNSALTTVTKDTPADLLAKISATVEISNDIQITPSDSLEAFKTDEPAKHEETNNMNNDGKIIDTSSCVILKPVYDPTLKIPQYKIKTTLSTNETVTSILSVSSDVIPHSPNPGAQSSPIKALTNSQNNYVEVSTRDKSSFDILDSSLNVNKITGSIPIYTITKPGISKPLNRFESTNAVYTLANACISVTKIESSSSATLTNTLLGIPGTTITSTTSIYTLAGTTVGMPTEYKNPNNTVPLNHSSVNLVNPSLTDSTCQVSKLYDQASSSIINKSADNLKISNNLLIGVDQDPETAKKIAMLPKELVEILGTMPAGHRNQLLNVLPQYVVTSTGGSSSNQNEVTVQDVTIIKSPTSCESSELYLLTDANKSSDVLQNKEITCINLPSVSATMSNNSLKNILLKSTDIVKDDNKHSISLSVNSRASEQNQVPSQIYSEEIKPLPRSNADEHENSFGVINTNKESYIDRKLSYSLIPNNNLNTTIQPTIIDLTEDDVPDSNQANLNLDIEVPQPPVHLPRDEHTVEIVKQKSCNNNTASLRAVRIKAPSERNKSNVIDLEVLPKNIAELPLKLKLNEQNDIEARKSLVPVAIPQVDISSIKYNSENTTNDDTCLTLVSPVEVGSSLEELSGGQTLSSSVGTIEKKSNDPLSPIQTSIMSTLPVSTNSKVQADLTVTVDFSPERSSVEKYKTFKEIVNSQDSLHPPNTQVFASPKLTSEISVKESIRKDDDNDSEDDVSLAIIVKQKMMDQEKCCTSQETVKSSNNKYLIKKKEKKVKKGEKIAVESNQPLNKPIDIPNIDETKSNESIHVNNECRLNKAHNYDTATNTQIENLSNKSTNVSLNPVNMEDEYVNKQMKDISNVNDEYSGENKQKENCNTELYKTGLNKENSSSSKNVEPVLSVTKNPLCEEANTNNAVTVEDVKRISHKFESESESNHVHKEAICTVKLCTSIQSDQCNITKNSEALTLGEVIDKKEHIEKNTSNKSVNSYSNDLKNENIVSDFSKPTSDRDKEEKKVFIVHELKSYSEDSDTQISDSTLCSIKNRLNGEPPGETLQNSINAEATMENDMNIVTGKEEKLIVVPLRRSRRGKSMYIENSPVDNIVTEMSIEPKAPLTKKQLIFSKLLLDEEKQSDVQSNLLLENVSNVEIEINEPITNTSNLDSLPIINDGCVLSNKRDNNKSVKRKKSPQLKRKNKKRRSLDSTNLDDANNRQRADNIPSSKYEEETELNQLEEKLDKSSKSLEQSTERNLSNSLSGFDEKSCDTSKNLDPKDLDGNFNDINKGPSSTEKRKLNLPTITADIGHLPKVKKAKLNKNAKLTDLESNDNDHKIVADSASKINDTSNVNVEIRTTCYNKPAVRRTRSKSVFVKSSVGEFYDPYDIDMDEMIEKSQPFSNKILILDEKLVGNRHTKQLRNSTKSSLNNKGSQNIVEEGAMKLTKQNINTLNKSDLKSEPVRNSINHISDSDDSTTSDVPLTKYIEEKEKKLKEQEGRLLTSREIEDDYDIDQSELDDDKQNDKEDRKSRRTLAVFNNVETVAGSTTEIDEQLRSEQFMESFGFFSERKPRKSNLLASKKISETFHVIANESEDMYYGVKDKTVKKSLQNENRKSIEKDGIVKASQHSSSKKAGKRGRKKKSTTKIVPCYCGICKKEFRRSDNYLRHQMTLLHISKLSEIEMKVKTAPVHEEPNYLIVYKQHLDRLKILTDKLAKCKKKSKSAPKIILPTMEEIVAEVNKTVREQQLSQRGLSRDEALFLDCCELLKESHKNDLANVGLQLPTDVNVYVCGNQGTVSEFDLITKRLNEDNTKSDGDVDSITAKNILESEEVRNLENDLISGLKEAANASNAKNLTFPRSIDDIIESQEMPQNFSNSDTNVNQFSEIDETFEQLKEPVTRKTKKHTEVKEKMYPDIDTIDMFEDKFDKIKRKCRSQAAAAKQAQTAIEVTPSYKGRKKSEKKKGKKSSKKSYQSTQVLTKGALKGFDGIKVSIPTSDINMSAIVPTIETPSKKKKKNTSKKKREKKESESSGKYDSDHRVKENPVPQKKVDVYEFMDNEDAELFEFRPSTLMERFKSMNNKDVPSTSKFNPVTEDADISSDSISDGDDFVYMSDDYVCSDDETENSLMSCELGSGKINSDIKKTASPLKRKDIFEKNAVMGKIFKNNAVRSEKKNSKVKETVKPKANLDQLFDSLLEDEPNSSMLNDDLTLSVNDDMMTSKKQSPTNYKASPYARQNNKPRSKGTQSSSRRCSTLIDTDQDLSSDKFDLTHTKAYDDKNFDSGPSNSKRHEEFTEIDYGPSTSKIHDKVVTKEKSAKKHDNSSSKKHDRTSSRTNKSPIYKNALPVEVDEIPKTHEEKSLEKSNEDTNITYGENGEQVETCYYDEAGVARQRARRKCTVGKQNVLAETWSSESEPDGLPPRPNSAESIIMSSGRRRKGKKKEGSHSGTRRGSSRHVIFRKQDVESRVNSSSRSIWSRGRRGSGGSQDSALDAEEDESLEAIGDESRSPSPASPPVPSTSGSKPRPRTSAYCWSSEGDEEQEHVQQHGWIVCDSHKKLVTMLAHAKGRKRNNDDKRHLVD